MNSPEIKIVSEEVGVGKTAVKGALCFCHYEGFLDDGTKFDSSLDHGRPFEFVLGSKKVIPGWSQGMMGMQEGGKRVFFVPSELGYQDRSVGKYITPHSNLTFHVELLEVRLREE